MEKLKLKLCAGTLCYVMGGAELMEIGELLSAEEQEWVEITLTPCLHQCNDGEKPPFAELDGEMLKGISKETLLRIIKEKINNAVR